MCTDMWCDWSDWSDCVAILPGVVNVNSSNKNIIDNSDITVVEALIDKSNQLTETYFAKKTDSLAVDR